MDDVVSKVSAILVDYAERRDSAVRSAVRSMEESNTAAAESWRSLRQEQAAQVENTRSSGQARISLLHKRAGEGKRKRDEAMEVRFLDGYRFPVI